MAEKTISELTPIAQLSDDALFVAEQDGASGSVTAAQLRGGLPTPGADGTALISVDGAWKQQSGYGYSSAYKITWDGDTEGHELLRYGGGDYYKMTSDVFTTDMLSDPVTGVLNYGGEPMDFSYAKSQWSNVQNAGWDIMGVCLVLFGGSDAENGVYFPKISDDTFTSEITLSSTAQKFDPMLLGCISVGDGKLMQNGQDVTDAVKAALGIT